MEACVTRQTISTTSVLPTERLGYWLDTVCSLYCGLDCLPPLDAEMYGHVELTRVFDIQVSHLRSNGRQVRRTQEHIRRSTEDHYLVLLMREGRGVVRQDGRQACLMRAGEFVLHDCTRPYELSFESPYHELDVLRLPRARLDAHVRNLDDLTATTVPTDEVAGKLLLGATDALHRTGQQVRLSSALAVEEAVVSIIAAGVRGLPNANERQASSLAAYHLHRIKAFVMQNLRDPGLSVAAVAHAMQLSPDHVRRLFRADHDSLPTMIWQLRLDACRRDLCDPRLSARSACEIAFFWGFNNAAHFSRSFRRAYGISPRDWRAGEEAKRLGSSEKPAERSRERRQRPM